MMKPKEIQELLDFIASSGLAEVNIETEQFKINVKRNATAATVLPAALPQVIQPAVLPQQLAPLQTTAATENPAQETANAGGNSKQITIKSPMIGTFYRSSSPDTPALVNVGDEISKGKALCIIEAMKLFNEIESEYEGKIVKILVENATPVEFDQPLFIIEQK